MSLILETRHLTKRFDSLVAVSDVSLGFAPGKIHALLGENGAGKSTLMKLLFGLHQPTSGEILVHGQPVVWRSSMDAIASGLGMVQQHFSLVDTLSAIDNISLGAEMCGWLGRLDRRAEIAKLERILPHKSLAVPWDAPVAELSVGQKQRVEILKLLFRESKILFLDEPTAVLTPSEINEFFEVLRTLRDSGRTIVLITHKINEVLQICDTYTVLRQGRLISSGQLQGRPKDEAREVIVESMIGQRLPEATLSRCTPREQRALECRDLREVSDERGRISGISLDVGIGEIVGVAGVEGSGQGRFVEALMGLRPFEGELRILGQEVKPQQTNFVRSLGVGLVPEDRHSEGLWLEESCHLNMIVGLEDHFLNQHIFDFDRVKTETTDWAKEFDVRASSLQLPVEALSGGNQQKVIFAREVSGRRPRFLVCHQPTRGVDLGAIDLIHRRLVELRNEGMGVVVLSSELDELLALCDRIFVFFEGRVVAEFSRGRFDRMKIGAAMMGVRHDS
jgi:ABC-type uncharacterized transport system ATPase subunit